MKLRNKKTGAIATLTMSNNGESLLLLEDGKMLAYNIKLSDLEEWEDYEESKEYWTIDWTCCGVANNKYSNDDIDNFNKQIGNYFETKEEAERAVEKLKSWKRLKDNYFIKFNLDFAKNSISFNYRIDGTLHSSVEEERIIFKDLKILFGGEND